MWLTALCATPLGAGSVRCSDCIAGKAGAAGVLAAVTARGTAADGFCGAAGGFCGDAAGLGASAAVVGRCAVSFAARGSGVAAAD